MRRLVLVFLMLLMALQSTWSAAASMCTHEQDSAAQHHFGHHDAHHEHSTAKPSAADAVDPDDPDAVGPGNPSPSPSQADTLGNDHHHALNDHPVPHISLPASPAATARQQPVYPFDRFPSALIASLERPPKADADSLRQGF